MTTRHPLTISLTPELAQFVATEVRSGQYGSASEVIRAGLRLLVSANGPAGADHGSTRDLPKDMGLQASRTETRRG